MDDRRARRLARDVFQQLRCVGDCLAVDLQQNVAAPEAGRAGRRIGLDLGSCGPALGRQAGGLGVIAYEAAQLGAEIAALGALRQRLRSSRGRRRRDG